MANAIRTALFAAALVLVVIVPPSAMASADPGVPTTGATVLGAGFSGKPFVLDGDMVIETIGLYESIRDYQDATNPDWVAWYDHALGGLWEHVLHDDGLLVALRGDLRPGFEVVDLSDPGNPVGLADVDANLFESGWLGDQALIVSGEDFLLAYDLVDPTEPVFASFRVLGLHAQSRWFSEWNSRLYIIDHDATLRVFDITTPLQPVDLGTVSLAGDRIDAMVAGDGVLYALVAGGGALDLVTYDLTDPLDPRETSRTNHTAAAGAVGLQLCAADELLLAGSSDALIRAYDVSDPTRLVEGYELPLVAEHLDVSDNRVFVMTGQDVRIFPRTAAAEQPGAPVVRSRLPRLQTIDGDGPVQIGQLHGDRNLIVPIDASNPRHPKVGAPFDTGLRGAFYYADDIGLMVTLNGSFQLVDLSVPLEPDWLGSVDLPRVYFFRAALTGEVAVLETGSIDVELRFYDLTDPMEPHFRTKVYDYGLQDIEGDIMVCSRSDRIRIYDVSDLDDPRFVRQVFFDDAVQEVHLHQYHAYVLVRDLSGARRIHSVRLTDPAYPVVLGSVELNHNAGELDAHDGRLYTYGYHICQIIDVADPEHLEIVAEFPAYGHTGPGLAFNGDVTTVGGWLVSMRDDGLSVSAAPDQIPTVASRLEPAYPNPLNPSTNIAFTVGSAQELTLAVHDVRGRLVAHLATGRFEAGRHTVRWNGEDSTGLPVASGVYLVRLHGKGLDASGTVTVVK